MIMTCCAFDAAAEILMVPGREIQQYAVRKAASGLVLNNSTTAGLSNVIVPVFRCPNQISL